MHRTRVLHPFLFALFPVVFFYSRNFDYFLWTETLIPCAVSLLAVYALGAGLFLLFREPCRAGLVASLCVLIFHSYGHLCNLILGGDPWSFGDTVPSLVFAGCLVAVALAIFIMTAVRRPLLGVTAVVNFVALVALLLPLGTVASRLTRQAAALGGAAAGKQGGEALPAGETRALPDIYYLILDTYARADTLGERLDYPDPDFFRFLREKGFIVAERSVCNYLFTHASLASSLNMTYIDSVARATDRELADMVEGNAVRRFLAARGYDYRQYSQVFGGSGAQAGPHAVDYDFSALLLGASMAKGLLEGSSGDAAYEEARSSFLSVFAAVDRVPEMRLSSGRPSFVFAHSMGVHAPFLFGRRGERLAPAERGQPLSFEEYRRLYVNQLIFVNALTRRTVSLLLSRSPVRPIIILQADHGPHLNDLSISPDDMIRHKSRILNAYYVPEKVRPLLYPSITPVNSFRMILDGAFGAHLRRLDDRCYYAIAGRGSAVIDVTDKTR